MQNQTVFHIDNYTFTRMIGCNAIQNRISEIANQINIDYCDKEPIFLITMKGAMFFAIELLKKISVKHTIETINAKSYGNKMSSSGNVEIKLNDIVFLNKNIIIIEDIIDTGLTIQCIINELDKQNPASIRIATLIKKPKCDFLNIRADYWGFKMKQDDFIIGFGLDYKEYGRHLNGLYTLTK